MGNVHLIDPLDANINKNIPNGMPQYEDMNIFAELVAIKRGRTVLSTNINGNVTNIDTTGANSTPVNISFLGANQDKSSPNYNKFTTNYYDGSVGPNATQYNSFGIRSIDVLVNSSYIPSIKIEFVDVRGLAFFNRENSPYRILYDFPPPIFYLTFKGYYGKAITYQMHLVKYTTEFKSENGNYIINADFIAISYAPLTDIPFRYIVQMGLMSDVGKYNADATLSPNLSKAPINTLDLILKLKNLYSSIPQKIKTNTNNEKYEVAKKYLDKYSSAYNILNDYYNNDILKQNGTPFLFTYDSDSDNIRLLPTLSDYDKIIENTNTNNISNIPQKLEIGFAYNSLNMLDQSTINSNIPIDVFNKYSYALTQYESTYLISKTNALMGTTIKATDFPAPIVIRGFLNNTDVYYVALDVTKYYQTLYTKKTVLEQQKNSASAALSTDINNMVQEELGMMPTIKNIFQIMLNDVDKFFQIMRDTSIAAQEHHNSKNNYAKIANYIKYSDYTPTIYPFPLVTKEQKQSDNSNCSHTTTVRIAPVDISNSLTEPFPELVLVKNFIKSFTDYNDIVKEATLEKQQNGNGNNIWIPFTPEDSDFFNSAGPYYNIDSINGISSTSSLSKLDNVMSVAMSRFYILTQNVLPYTFYTAPSIYYGNKNNSDSYIKLYAKAEAINLINSINNDSFLDLLNENAKLYSTPSNFYTYLDKNLNSLYTKPSSTYKITGGNSVYVDKNIVGFNGCAWIPIKDISIKTESTDTGIFGDFWNNIYSKQWYQFWAKRKITNNYITPEQISENIVYFPDKEDDKYTSKFLSSSKYFYRNFDKKETPNIDDMIFGIFSGGHGRPSTKSVDIHTVVNNVNNEGNLYFYNNNIYYDYRITRTANIKDVFSSELGSYATNNYFYNTIIDHSGSLYDKRLSALIYLSSFGYTLSPFNWYPNNLNYNIFTTPSIAEIPIFLKLYVGLLCKIIDGNWDLTKEEVINYFTNNGSNSLSYILNSGGILILADLYDIENYLSQNDRDIFAAQFSNFYDSTTQFDDFAQLIKALVDDSLTEYNITTNTKKLGDILLTFLDKNGRYAAILDSLVDKDALAIFNELTFRFDNGNGFNINNSQGNNSEFYSLKTINATYYPTSSQINYQQSNDLYFTTFFNEIQKLIIDKKSNLGKKSKAETIKGDIDIITQTYYSFKNVYDKWIAGLNKNLKGYPFKNDPNGGLIDQFVFVDRAMNSIGDTIIDTQPLLTALDDPNISIFSVISELLSVNGFEFFPLQSFLKFNNDEWKNSFKIQTGKVAMQYPVFVCMYIGGASSYPTTITDNNDYLNDGIVDLLHPGPGVTDFVDNCNKPDAVTNLTESGTVGEVKAFRVKFGQQNQSMFSDIKIDSKEYPETNESIHILAQIAGDNRLNAPIPKGQNLYSLYENRSYKATVSGLGNAMIQPTEYFQLENVPLFNGAYVILTVEHNIQENRMKTSFSGTKIQKYPNPRVLSPAAIFGFGGSSTETNITTSGTTNAIGTAQNPQLAQYNSMYTLKIQK